MCAGWPEAREAGSLNECWLLVDAGSWRSSPKDSALLAVNIQIKNAHHIIFLQTGALPPTHKPEHYQQQHKLERIDMNQGEEMDVNALVDFSKLLVNI